MTIALSAGDRRRLRAQAHPLAPVAQVGKNGLSEAFLVELDRALASHELVKVRLRGERDQRTTQLENVTARLACTLVGTVGAVAILYRPTDDAGVAAGGKP